MPRLSRIPALTILVVFLLACNVITQPFEDVAETAQSIGSAIPVETLQALPSAIPSVISAETLQALPSLAPTLEAFATNMPDMGDIFNPQGTPVQEWRGIPVMPQATAGQEFAATNTYSFRAAVTMPEVRDFYNERMTALGWNQPFDLPEEGDTGLIVFQKDNSVLTIAITASGDSVVVVLTLA